MGKPPVHRRVLHAGMQARRLGDEEQDWEPAQAADALYFFVILYAMIGKPFSRRVHVGLAIALLANAGLQFYTEDILGALISLLFAYFAYNDRDRFKSA